MKISSRASRFEQAYGFAINVGDSERTFCAVVGGMALLYGLSRLSFSTVVATFAGGVLLYRGLTGHCSVYRALDVSTCCGLENQELGARSMPQLHEVTDASLAATGESLSEADFVESR